MNLNMIHFYQVKKLFPILFLCLLFSIPSFAQESNIKISNPNNSTTELNQKSQKTIQLFEEVHQQKLTTKSYHTLLNSSTENLKKWEKVLAHFKNDATKDTEYIQQVINGMKEKLAWAKE